MDQLPTTMIQQICEYDPTYKDIFYKVLIQLNMHYMLYRCSECCCHYNTCYCYYTASRTLLRICRQLYVDQDHMTEADEEQIIPMTR